MSVFVMSGAEQLPPEVDAFLAERVERNVMASLLVNVRAGLKHGHPPRFAWLAEGRGIRWFAMRIPPWPLLVSELGGGDARAQAESLMERWLQADPGLPGVSGVPVASRAVAAAWAARTGGRTSCRMSDAIHVLSDVIDPQRPPPGTLRPAGEADRDLLVAWERAFVDEAGVPLAAALEAERTIERRLASASQYLWDDEGPASTLVLSPRVAGTVRIGPVYTPAARRRRGYASVAVAEASRLALSHGASRCMLFTDLANATSNKIYAAVGFRRYGDWEEHEFLPTEA